jgi:transcriptional regulator with XRE-family HTH domain
LISGRQIKTARESLGWTRENLAMRAGVRVTTVIAFESETIYPQKYAVAAIRAALALGGLEFSVEGKLVRKVRGRSDGIGRRSLLSLQ